jgi:large subunit ribosomal protein L22
MVKDLRYTLGQTTIIWAMLASGDEYSKIKSITATLRYAQSSVKKIELVAKLIRWKPVDEALRILEFAPQKAAKILLKVLKSAIANAVNNLWLNADNLFVARVDVGRWPKLKRVRFASRARVHGYIKHRSFIRVVLDIK